MQRSKKKEPASNHSLKTIALFCLIVFLLITVSIAIRTFQLFQKSKFDGKRNFTIAIFDNKKQASIITFDSVKKVTSVLFLSSDTPLTPIGKTLGIPIDEQIISPQYTHGERDIAKQLVRIGLQFQNARTDLTIIDTFRLALFAKTTSTTLAYDDQLVPSEKTEDLSKTVPDAFLNERIINEDQNIAIVNATGVAGLGKRLERMLLLLGGNVISVTSSTAVEQRSHIMYKESESYTVMRLQELLGLPATMTDQQILSDIIITIGTDSVTTTIY